jgi:thiamine biosynthesis lipoprotein
MLRLIFGLLFPFTLSAQLKRFQFTENKMGSPFSIILYHTDSAEAVRFAGECFLLVDSLNTIFSDYNRTSEAARLTQQPQVVSDELMNMILKSEDAWIKSGKTFDITIGALTQLWRKSRSEKRFPSAAEVRKARRSTGFEKLIITADIKTVAFKHPGVRLDFGGIVKGHAAQRVIDYLKKRNILSALADAGGDIVVGNTPPGKSGWGVSINMPENENELWDKNLELKNCAVATSGDLYRFTIHKGKKYSHIIDPRTGYGVTSLRNVTVIARDGVMADWLATACSILPVEKALALARKENADLFIATLKEETIVIHKTENFDNHFKKKEE